MFPDSKLLLPAALILVGLGPARGSQNSCDPGWFDASFLDLGCIQFDFTYNATWEEANNYCQQKDAQVIELSNLFQLGACSFCLQLTLNIVCRFHSDAAEPPGWRLLVDFWD